MNTQLAEQGIRLREYRWEDIPPMVDISNRTWSDDPTTVENEEHLEKTYPPALERKTGLSKAARLVAMGEMAVNLIVHEMHGAMAMPYRKNRHEHESSHMASTYRAD